ncbi:MAG: ATP-binding protein [Eubacterium sp.]|nr:ATP-binding protein [Eubacterium sp.]
MNYMISFLLNVLLCILEVYMLEIFFGAMFARRVSEKRFLLYCGGAICIMIAVNLLKNPLVNFVALPVLFFVFARLAFTIAGNKAFVYAVIYYIIFAGEREMAFEMLYRFLLATFPRLETILPFANAMFFYVGEYLLSFLFLLYLRKYLREITIREEDGFEWYLLVMPVSSVLILFSFVYMDFPNERMLQMLVCGGAFLLYFSNAVIFIILAHFTQVMNRVKIAEMALLKRDMEKENFENTEKMNEVYRRYMHDIHKYFYQFRSLALTGEAEAIVEIIDGWETNLKKEKENKRYIASPVMNSLLSECYERAKEKKIEIDIFVEDALDVSFIQDADKISMFGNLLDNAIEAADECEEGKRKINIEMYMGNKYMLVFKIENIWKQEIQMEGDRLLSTKKDSKNHGLGLKIARELAQKYNGSLEWEIQEEWFITMLMIAC